jgi:hypothetical protein
MSAADWLICTLLASLLTTAGVAVICVLPTPEKSTVRTHFVLTYIASLILLAVYWNASASSGSQGFAYSDDEMYHAMGKAYAESGDIQQSIDSAGLRNPGFVLWTAYLYKFLGSNTIVVRLFNILFRCLWIVPIAFLCTAYGDPRTTRLAIYLSAWAPSALLIGILHVKDVLAILAFLTALAAIAFMRSWRNALFTLLASCAVIELVRQDLMLLVVPLATLQAARILFNQKRKGLFILLFASVTAVAARSLPAMLSSWNSSVNFSDALLVIFSLTGQTAETANGLAPFFIQGFADLWKLPFSMAIVTILPFPPDLSWTNVYITADGIASIFVLVLFPFALAGCLFSLKGREETRLPALAGLLGCAALLAIVFPGAIRYREQMISLFSMMAAVGLRNWRDYKRLVIGSALCMVCAVIVGSLLHMQK